MAVAFGSGVSIVPQTNTLRPTAPLAFVATSVLFASLLLALGLAGWLSYGAEYREARQRSMGVARLVANETARMIEAADLFLFQAADLAAATDWSNRDAAAAAQRKLKALGNHLPYLLEYGLFDADGDVRITDSEIAPHHNIADRPFFQVHRESDAGLHIGRLFRAQFGRDAGRNVFALSRRVSTPDGRFSGVATIVFAPAALASYYRSLGGDFPLTLHLLDLDARVLMRDPPATSPDQADGVPDLRAILGGNAAGTVLASVDGAEHVWSYQRVESYPLYVMVDFATAAVLHRWLDRALGYVLFSLAALAALAALSYELVHHARKEDRLRRRLVSADALAQSQERLNAALLASGTGTYRWDLRSGAIYRDENLCRLRGLRTNRLVGHVDDLLASIHPSDRATVGEALRRCAREGADFAMDYRVIRPDGSTRWLTDKGRTVLDPSGAPLHITGACTDITERKSAEDALMQAKAQAEEASLSKSRFLMAASHDLRQPLQTIGNLAAILETSPGEPERRHCLASLREAHGSMVVLLNTLLDMDRMEMGAVEPEVADFPVNRLLDLLRREFEPLARAKGLRLRVQPSGAMVRSDFGLVKELVQNLISNAVKYTVAGKVLLGCRRSGDQVRIEVWDTGIGIAEEEQERIFEEFYQIDNAARERGRGHGLGLAIARRMANLLDSRIEMRSTPGKGSVFRVALPAGTAGAESGEAKRTDRIDRIAPTEASILLIEDDPAILESLGLLLQLEGFRVTTAIDSDEALRRIREGAAPPDVVVADYRLPGSRNGLEAIRSIRVRTGRHVPGVILTGDISRHIAHAIEEAGCALLHKPGDAVELIAVIRRSLTESAEAQGSQADAESYHSQ